LKDCFSPESANQVFSLLVPRIVATRDDPRAGVWTTTLKKLLKRYPIDEELSQSLVTAIVGGRLGIFWGRPTFRVMRLLPPLFFYIAQYVKKAPSKAKPIIDTLVGWLAQGVYEPVPILIPVKAATSLRVIDEPTADRLGPIVKGILKLFDATDGEEVGEVASLLVELYEKFPKSLEPVSELLDSLVDFVLVAANKSMAS
jgi:hypothetical protein